jgi:DNA-directed RNA polymerase specialized sigma24 family protein
MTVDYDQATGRYFWVSTRNSSHAGTSDTYHEARWSELYDEMRYACVGVLKRHDLDLMDDLVDDAMRAVLHKFEREPEAAKNTNAWIRYRAVLYLRGRITKRMETMRMRCEVSLERLTSTSLPVNPFTNESASRQLKSPSEIRMPDFMAAPDPIAEIDGRIVIQDILAMLQRPSHKTIVAMLCDGATQEEIGLALHVSSAAIRSQIRTIRSQLESLGARALLMA